MVGILVISAVLAQSNLYLPPQSGPLNVAPTVEEIELGRALFFDKRLSQNGTVSCATCHDPNKGWADGRPVAIGILNQAGDRNTPTIINTGWIKTGIFWDNRNFETTDQAILPIQNPIEMGQQTVEQVTARLRQIQDYNIAFTKIYGVNGLTVANLARSLACFESTINEQNAPIDMYLRGDLAALTDDQKIGYELFKKHNCQDCHPPPFWTDHKVHNVGVEFATRGRIVDRGRAKVTDNTNRFARSDIAAFKTPTLRSIAKTAPYMHNGRMDTLERVVRHFNTGGFVKTTNGGLTRDQNIDTRIRKLDMTPEQELYLVEFLRTAFEAVDHPLVGAP